MIEKRYFCKHLTDDGLLKEPDDIGPHYDRISLNEGRGFIDEDTANACLERFYKNGYGMPFILILIAEYFIREEKR